MGVNLSSIVEPKVIDFEFLSGRTVAIDSYNIIYQFLSSIRQYDGTPLLDESGEITSHLSGLFYRTINLLSKNIKMIFVFDGEPPIFKKEEIKARRKVREEAKEKWKEALKEGRTEEAQKYAKMSSTVTKEMVEESKTLLTYMGLPVIQAKSEGEAQCARICSDNKAFATVSQDFDSLLFGSPRIIRNLSVGKDRPIEIIELSQIGYERRKLILASLLIGTDYNPGIKGIGPKKAIKLVEECQTIEKLKQTITWDFEIPIEELYNFFLKPPVFDDYEIKSSSQKPDKVVELLCKKHNFSEERVVKSLEKLTNKKSQTSLFGF